MVNYIFLLGVILRPNLMPPFTDLDRVIFYLFISVFLSYFEHFWVNPTGSKNSFYYNNKGL